MDLQKLRKWNRSIHRDLGYICFGLTIIYAISGIAVNHIQDWNPNYKIEHRSSRIGLIENTSPVPEATVKEILHRLGKQTAYKSTFQPDPATLKIFVDQNTITVNLATGEVVEEIVSSRPVIYETNFLHLNLPKKLWTYIADLYAASLAVLAVTGLFVLKGRKGITGRGAWLTGLGILIPLFFLYLYL